MQYEVRSETIDETDCECGHKWSKHKRITNGAFACSHHGCGCRDVVYPVHVEQPYYEEQGNVLEV